VESPEYQKQLSELKEEFKTGKTYSQEQVECLHQQLSDEGL
jgi:hypothetical protein